jgi:carboxyl-terminal processing protease
VDSVTYAQLVHAAIDGVLRSLDPHSYFLSRADGERQLSYQEGRLAGTGIILDDVDGVATVLAVLPGSPAAKAGVQPGDRAIALNDTSVAGVTVQALQSRLVGEKGSKVKLVFERGPRLEPDSFKVTIKNDFIRPRSVQTARLVNATTGYLRLIGFQVEAPKEVEESIKQLKSSGARQLIFDLRGNPGGFVFGAVGIASSLLPKGTVVFRTQSRRRNAVDTVATEKDGAFRDLPMILLIDERSASASEILAGTLQDHDRALILGQRSFGKALIQSRLEVPPQGDVVWLTTARVVTPSGRVVQRRYQGLNAEQYYSFAGRSGAEQDTVAVYQTDHGRPVRGGGGIIPDVPLPRTAELPVWWSVAADSGFVEAIADSVAQTLGKDAAARNAWMTGVADWQTRLVTPFLERTRSRLKVAADADSALRARIGRNLAARVAQVRWGDDGSDEFLVRNDPGIQAALGYFPKLGDLLKGP